MTLGAVKPGRYQPKCKQCSKPFVLKVTDDVPPKFGVGKIKPIVAVDAAVDATMDATMPVVAGSSIRTAATVVDATMAAGATMKIAAGETRVHSASAVRVGGSARSGALSGDAIAKPTTQEVAGLDIPQRLGGYRILRLLGRGAMGAVYEAKQLSLDRNVALKTIRGRLADSPSALARFTREAYAAAQLVHHNVVQIYDFGQDNGQHFFSMEWVRGGPLSDLIRDNGPLDPRVAATYTLQAARGLQFAHRNGMVHRDVKPANLLLNDEGVVKVADLGLVKVPDQPDPESDVGAASAASGMASGTQVTMMGTAVGTPAYMAPEQGVDATTVDHRADVYSLGCTLFYLLTGKAPFDGSQVSVVMKQHAQDPIPKVQLVNPRVPDSLGRVIEHAMAKRPDDRYSSVADMIGDLESFLGLQSAAGFSPSSQQADRWEELAKAHAAAPLAKLQKPVVLGFLGLCGLLLLVTPLLGFRFALMSPATFVMAIAVALVFGSGAGRSAVVTRLRGWFGSLSWFDMVVGVVVAIVMLLVVVLVGLWPGVLVGAVLGSAAGAAYHFMLVKPLQESRAANIVDAERFVRDLRIEGIDEDKLRDFAARYSGATWRGLFEALFGYDATKAKQSQLMADPAGKQLAGGATFRDRVCNGLQSKATANRTARDHQRLATLEEQGLKSEGMSAADAKERAWQMASAMIDATKLVPMPAMAAADPKAIADERRNRMKAMLAEARSGKYAKQRDKLAPLRFALGAKVRLLAGCALLALTGWWAYSNGLVSAEALQSVRDSAASGMLDVDSIKTTVTASVTDAATKQNMPKLLGANGWAVGFAGMLLAGSAFIGGWRISLFIIPAVILAIFGESFGIPAIGPFPAWTIAAAAAAGILIPGVLFTSRD